MHALYKSLSWADSAWYRVERALLLGSLVMMTLLVFADVVLRSFTRPVGKTASFFLYLAERSGPVDDATRAAIVSSWGPLAFWTLFCLLCVGAVHASRTTLAARGGLASASFAGSLLRGGAAVMFVFALVKALVWLFPTGLAGAQRFALGFMVWAGFLGTSLATRARRHIVLDAVKKKLDPKAAPWFSALGGLVTGAFTLCLVWLALTKLTTEIEEWRDIPNVGTFESLPIPVWVVTLALPVTLLSLALRFLCYGLGELLYGASLLVEPDELARELRRVDDATPAEASTVNSPAMLYGAPHPTEGRPTPREATS